MSESHKKYRPTPETIEKMKLANSGEGNGAAKLNAKKVLEIYKLYDEGMTQAEIAEIYGLTQPSISCVTRGKTWPKLYQEYHSVELN